MKIAKKAEELTKKRNLDGTNLSSNNAFSVLNNDNLLNKTCNMRVKINMDNLEVINVMKDLEIARHTMENKKIEEIREHP